MALAAALAIIRGESAPSTTDLAWTAVAGVLGGIGMTCLYRGLAVGRMGVVAPVTGLLAAIIPVIAGFILEALPGPATLLGIVVALIAVVLVSRVEDEGGGRAGLELAVAAGTSIGLFGVAMSRLSDGHVFGPLVVIRAIEATMVVAFIVVTRNAWRPSRAVLPAIVGVGLLDMVGNAAYLAAIQTGALAVASVVSSLYPVTTVILAMLFLREPMTRSHAVGIVLAAIALVLIGAGSG